MWTSSVCIDDPSACAIYCFMTELGILLSSTKNAFLLPCVLCLAALLKEMVLIYLTSLTSAAVPHFIPSTLSPVIWMDLIWAVVDTCTMCKLCGGSVWSNNIVCCGVWLNKQGRNPGWMMLFSAAGECKVCLRTAYGWDLLVSPYVQYFSNAVAVTHLTTRHWGSGC